MPTNAWGRRLAVVVLAATVSGCGSSAASPGGGISAPSGATAPTVSPSVAASASPGGEPSTGPAASASAASRPTAPLTARELSTWSRAAAAFIARFDGSLHSPETPFASFTEDAAILDPSNGDFRIAPRSTIVERWRAFVSDAPGYAARSTATYVGRETIVSLADVLGLWPAEAPAPSDAYAGPGQPVVKELRVFRFAGDVPTAPASTFELWYRLEADEYQLGHAGTPGVPCEAWATCAAKILAVADGLAAAWASGDATRIAALYRDDATSTDSVLGVRAQGRQEIGRSLAAGRLGACTVDRLYSQTNDGDPLDSDNRDPDGGKLIGLAMVGTCQPTGASGRVGVVRVVLFGRRTGGAFALDPGGLIASDETFYAPESLLSSGLVS